MLVYKNNISKMHVLVIPQMSLSAQLVNIIRSVQGPVSRKSRNFSGAFRVTNSLCIFIKRRRLEARNFVVIFIFILFTTYEMTSFTE